MAEVSWQAQAKTLCDVGPTPALQDGIDKAAKIFGLLVLAAQMKREDSYDKARLATHVAANPKLDEAGMIDYGQFYNLSMLEAAEAVAGKRMGYFIYLLNTYAWNDAQMQAEELMK